MQVGTYRFNCQFETDSFLPVFKGSTLRGGLGRSLKKVTCALRTQSCQQCLLTENCAYANIFETHKPLQSAQRQKPRLAARPHPYILEPPLDSRRRYGTGDPFHFNLTLFGKANEYLPHVVYAVEMMGQQGLGSGKGNGQGRFLLTAIRMGNETIYDGSRRVLDRKQPLVTLEIPAMRSEPVRHLVVRLETPLRLKHQNKFQDRLPFHLLIRTALRRISVLEQTYSAGEPDLDYRGLVRRAEQVATAHSDSKWVEVERYSSRQRTAMLIGGLLGIVRYEGELTEFEPLLKYCETTHLGKQTTFGLGKISVQRESAA